MESIMVRVDKKTKHDFRVNCLKSKRSMQYVLDKFIASYNAKHAAAEKKQQDDGK